MARLQKLMKTLKQIGEQVKQNNEKTRERLRQAEQERKGEQ